MAYPPAPVLSLAERHDSTSPEPLARAAAAGRSVTDAARLFEALTTGDDFGGLERLIDELAKARDAGHLEAAHTPDATMRLFDALPESDRAVFTSLAAAWWSRMTCALEVGFHAGFAAGRVR